MILRLYFKIKLTGVNAHAYNPSTCETDTGGLLQVHVYPDYIKYSIQVSMKYTIKFSLKTSEKNI